MTCTYTQPSEGKFVVPVGVGGVHVVARGSAGAATFGAPGGPGGQVSANLDVTFGVPLFVEVGIGGGAGGADAAGGGGESDVRSCSITEQAPNDDEHVLPAQGHRHGHRGEHNRADGE